ncbi:SPOR domain-containing protein [Methylopila sp. M107]|uniref:SPOR domain-containing protein n=1 Tax=Methylopila sp. M107 TaxID=1101190 RepID=UPI000371B05A|nr:SPOR domain-containing protein [Methylopila sp. M107]
MAKRQYDDAVYDETAQDKRLSPAAPALIWGFLMAASIGCAGFTVWRASHMPEQRLIAAGDEALRRDMARLSAERDALSVRLAALERGVGDMKVAQRASDPETTGSVQKPAAASGARFALSLGMEPSLDAAKRRWAALSARFPQQLARLSPRVQREQGPKPMFDLVAGPYTSRVEAEQICGLLAEQGLACDTTDYTGDPLGRL